MNCYNCATTITNDGAYCSNCGTLIRCKTCHTWLYSDANFCHSCGTPTKFGAAIHIPENTNLAQNIVEYKETSTTKYLKASFTNEVGHSIGESIAALVNGKIQGSARKNKTFFQNSIPTDTTYEEASTTDITDNNNINDNNQLALSFDKKPTKPSISTIFKMKSEGQIILIENRLKATGKLDFSKRLTYLFLSFFNFLNKQATKEDIITFIGSTPGGLLDSHYREWLNKNDDVYVSDSEIFLRPSGITLSEQVLTEIFDNVSIDTWLPSDSGQKISKKNTPPTAKSEKDIPNKGAKTKSETYTLTELKINEDQRESLRAFFKEKKPVGQNDIVLVLTYWMKMNIGLTEFGVNEVYTAIQIVDIETPKALSQVLRNIKNDSKIILQKNGRYSLIHTGDDHVKFKLPSKKK